MPPTGELFRATISYNGSGGLNQNVLHFQGKTGLEDLDAFAVEAEGFLANLWLSVLPSTATLTEILCQILTPVAMDATIVTVSEDGDVVLPEDNSQLAVVHTLRTGVASKRKRGRFYMGCTTTAWQSGNSLNANGLGVYTTFRDAIEARYVGDSAASNYNLVVYSRAEGGDGPNYSLTGATPVTRIDVQPVLRVQRRRRVGVGS